MMEQFLYTDGHTDRRTDGRTDGQTDTTKHYSPQTIRNGWGLINITDSTYTTHIITWCIILCTCTCTCTKYENMHKVSRTKLDVQKLNVRRLWYWGREQGWTYTVVKEIIGWVAFRRFRLTIVEFVRFNRFVLVLPAAAFWDLKFGHILLTSTYRQTGLQASAASRI